MQTQARKALTQVLPTGTLWVGWLAERTTSTRKIAVRRMPGLRTTSEVPIPPMVCTRSRTHTLTNTPFGMGVGGITGLDFVIFITISGATTTPKLPQKRTSVVSVVLSIRAVF